MNREPTLDDLIGTEPTDVERQRMQHVHELLLEAGPPPELSPKLEAGPTLGMTLHRKRALKRRAMLLLAATLAVVGVFFGGYLVANGGKSAPNPVIAQLAPAAHPQKCPHEPAHRTAPPGPAPRRADRQLLRLLR